MEDNIFRSVSDIIKENKMHKREYWEKTMKKDTKTDLIILINTLDSIDDLNEIREMINDRRDSLARKTKYDLVVGEEVTISGSGKIESGKIIKINRTKAVVDCFDKKRDCMVTYDVPFSMIRKVVQHDA